jgi:hypothetical protein
MEYRAGNKKKWRLAPLIDISPCRVRKIHYLYAFGIGKLNADT